MILAGLVGGDACAADSVFDPAKLRPGRWAEVPNTDISKVVPKEGATPWGTIGPRAIIAAWGTASFDAEAIEIHINHQGGHGDYGGNEDYRLRLFGGQGWIRWSDPSKLDPAPPYYTPIGTPRPRSAHGWGGAVWVPTIKASFNASRSLYPSGDGVEAWLTYPETGTYEKVALPTPQPYYNAESLHAVWDKERKLVLNFRYNTEQFDPETRKITTLPPHLGDDQNFWAGAAAYDPDTQQAVFLSGNVLVLVDCRNPGRMSRKAFSVEKLAGDKPSAGLLGHSGIDYVPRLRKFAFWGGGGTVYLLDHNAPTPSFAALTDSDGAQPPKSNTSGSVYGRWKYVPKYDLFWALDWYPGNVFVWKVPN